MLCGIMRYMKDIWIRTISTAPELKYSSTKDFWGDFFKAVFLSICICGLHSIVQYEVFFGTY